MALNEDDDFAIEDEYEIRSGKNGIIFLIDARTPMFKKEFEDSYDEKQTSFVIALKCCRSVMMNKIIARESDLLAVVLFGTCKQDSKTNQKHLTLLLELNRPSSEGIKLLDSIMKDPDCAEFQQTHGSSDDFLISDALWYCSSLFSQSGTTFESKRVLLFTGDPDPHRFDPNHQHLARKRAKDIAEVNVALDLLPMGSNFDSKFYKELLQIINNSSEIEDPSSKLGELLERVNRINCKTRQYSNIKWDLGNNVRLGVSLRTLYRRASVLAQESLYRVTNEPVKSVRQIFDQETGDLLLPSDVEHYVHIGGTDIVFTTEEKDMMNKVDEPGMHLLGFRDLSSVTVAYHCGNPAFATPQETLVSGSKMLMKALVQRCSDRQKVALCSFTPRHRAITKFVYLLPSLDPCGFHVIPIPFCNELREQKLKKACPVDRQAIEIAKNIIGKLKFTYEPKNFQNPKLQKFWAGLEALALDYEAPDSVEDQTAPNFEAQTQRLGPLSSKFNEACSLSGTPSTSATKRPSSSSYSCNFSGKRVATGRGVAADDPKFAPSIILAAQQNKLEKFTVLQLQQFLQMNGMQTFKCSKAEAMRQVQEWVHKNPAK